MFQKSKNNLKDFCLFISKIIKKFFNNDIIVLKIILEIILLNTFEFIYF